MALIGTNPEDRTPAPEPAPEKPKHPLTLLSHQLEDRRSDYARQLRAVGIDFDTFKAAALTGINKTPDLLHAEKASLFDSLSQACRDGLLPDGREGALVIHRTNVAKRGQPDHWVDKVAWMPMVKGVLKKIRHSPDVASVHDGVIYKGDDYDWWVDDEGPHLKHRPSLDGPKRDSDIIAAYAIVRLTNGDRQIEVVGRSDLDKMKAASKSGRNNKGPWDTWYPQMAKKGAWHRLSSKLPLDDETMRVLNRDEELYDFDQAPRGGETDITPPKTERGKSSRLGALKAQHTKEPDDGREDHHAPEHDA